MLNKLGYEDRPIEELFITITKKSDSGINANINTAITFNFESKH